MTLPLDRNDAQDLDARDPLRAFRQRFHLPEGLIYLDGNSLGPAPKAAFAHMQAALHQEWAEGLITSWNRAGWFQLTDTLGDRLAGMLGAATGEVVITDSTSINLFKALHAGLSLNPGRRVVVAESASFPTDLYMLEGVSGGRSDISCRLEGVDAQDIDELIDEQVAVVLVNHVDYRSGRLRNMHAVTERAHAAGAVVVWDLCHSAGVLELDLNRCGVDFAVGCTYKYLNGGPGSPAFLFAAKRHHRRLSQPLTGWWGHEQPFAFDKTYRAAPGIRKFLCGTQPVLSLRALQAGLELYADVDIRRVREKSLALTDYFMTLIESRCADDGMRIISPRNGAERGSQVSIAHEHGYEIIQALIAAHVVGDYRRPNLMRFGFAPLYIRYCDVWDAVDRLAVIMQSEAWRDPNFAPHGVVT